MAQHLNYSHFLYGATFEKSGPLTLFSVKPNACILNNRADMAGIMSAAPIYPGSCRRHCLYEARGGRVGGGKGIGGGLQCVASLRLPMQLFCRKLF